jgi:SPRY domain
LLRQGCCSASINIVDGSKMKAVSGSHGAVCATTPLTRASGGGVWEFLYVKGKVGDEQLCFGFAKKPLESVSYNSEKLWLVRGYNGMLYGQNKVSGKTAPKLHETNRIRFTWNATSGDVTLAVNGVTDGVVFTGIRDAEIYPVVANYGTGDEAMIALIEHSTAAAAAVAATPAVSGAVRFDSVRGAGVRLELVYARVYLYAYSTSLSQF